MISARELRLTQLQLVYFTPEFHFATGPLVRNLLIALGNEFDGDVSAVPLPDEVPGNVPRLVLSSRDAELRLQLAFDRMDLFVRVRDGSGNLEQALNPAVDVLERAAAVTRTRVGRLALVVHRRLEVADAAERLVDHLYAGGVLAAQLDGAAAFEFHVLRKGDMGVGVDANLWLRAKARAPEDRGPAVDVEQDLNSFATLIGQLSLDESARRQFWTGSSAAMNQQFDAFFPEVTHA